MYLCTIIFNIIIVIIIIKLFSNQAFLLKNPTHVQIMGLTWHPSLFAPDTQVARELSRKPFNTSLNNCILFT